MKSFLNVAALCAEVFDLEQRGGVFEAAELLQPYWEGGGDVKLDGLTDEDAAHLLLRVGSVASALGGLKQVKNSQEMAREILSRAETLFIKISDDDGLAQCLYKVAISYFRCGELNEAKTYLTESMAIAVTDESKALALGSLAMIEEIKLNYDSALSHLTEAFQYIGNISPYAEGHVRNETGIIYDLLGRNTSGDDAVKYFDKAIIEYEGALVCYDALGNQRAAVLTRNNIGFLYYSINLFNEAKQALEIAKFQAYQLRDDINIAVVSDTLAQVFLALGELEAAELNALNAVEYSKEDSFQLSSSLITYGTALARGGKIDAAKQSFREAEELAIHIQDVELTARCNLFALNELFDGYNEIDRQAIYLKAVEVFEEAEDQAIKNALQEIAAKLTRKVNEPNVEAQDFRAEPGLSSEALESAVITPYSIDEKLKNLERECIERAIAQTGGHQSQTAQLLGLSRQTLVARVRQDFPDLYQRLNHISASKNKLGVFPTHSVLDVKAESCLGRITLTEDYLSYNAGDILYFELYTWHPDRIIALKNLNDEKRPKVGILRLENEQYTFEQKSNELVFLDEEGLQLIIGEAIGYCPADQYVDYLERRRRGEIIDLPLFPLLPIEFNK